MSRENLRDLLSELHARLRNAPTLDDDSRKLLTTVSHDIEDALARESQSADARASSPKPRLEALAVEFEAEHPQVAVVLRQLVDALAKAGI